MCPDEADVNRCMVKSDPHDQPILVSTDIEHHAPIFQDTGISILPFYLSRRFPICWFLLPVLSQPLYRDDTHTIILPTLPVKLSFPFWEDLSIIFATPLVFIIQP